jgi:hypothetical protein
MMRRNGSVIKGIPGEVDPRGVFLIVKLVVMLKQKICVMALRSRMSSPP